MPRVTISITVTSGPTDQDLITLDLPPGLTIQDLKAFVQAETNFPLEQQQLFLNGRPLSVDTQTIEEVGIGDGEMLALLIRQPESARRTPRGGGAGGAQVQGGQLRRGAAGRANGQPGEEGLTNEAIETLRMRLLGDDSALENIRQQAPELLDVLPDPVQFRTVYTERIRREQERVMERQRQIQMLNADPFNIENQKRIEEMIRQDRVVENLQYALENNPAVFARVTMLYIPTEVNGHPVKAFVDSGAQTTIMSPACAEACGIMRLIDTRYAGIAKGVGTAKILGRVHHAEIKIGNAIMACAFTVMEGKDVDLLFGLDMLKRFKARIDLEKNVLAFQGIEVPFLPESEIPKQWEAAQEDEPTVEGPNGTEIGARTGTIRPKAGSISAGSGQTSTATSSAAAGPSSSPAGGPPSSAFTTPTPPSGEMAAEGEMPPQASIDQLTNLGFSREDAIKALRATSGNVDYAANLLFSEQQDF